MSSGSLDLLQVSPDAELTRDFEDREKIRRFCNKYWPRVKDQLKQP